MLRRLTVTRLRLDIGSTLGANIVGAGALFAAGIVLARWLGPAARGTFEVAIVCANLGLLTLGLGLNLPATVFFYKERHRSIWAYRTSLKLALLYLAAGFGVLTILTIHWLNRSYREIGNVTVAAFGGLLVFQMVNALLMGAGRIQRMNIGVLTRWCTYLFGIVVLTTLTPPSAAIGVAWFGCAALFGGLVGLSGLRDVDRTYRAGVTNLNVRRQTIWFGLRGQIGNMFQFSSYRFDVILVQLWVGASGVGIYAVGVMFAEALWLIPNAVGAVLLSHTSRSERTAADVRIRTVFPATLFTTAVGGVVLAGVVPLLAPVLLGSEYRGIAQVVWLLLPGAVALSGGKVLANELTARGFPGTNTIIAGITAVITLGCDAVLIPSLGIQGAAAASSVGYLSSSALTVYAFRRWTSINPLRTFRSPLKAG